MNFQGTKILIIVNYTDLNWGSNIFLISSPVLYIKSFSTPPVGLELGIHIFDRNFFITYKDFTVFFCAHFYIAEKDNLAKYFGKGGN